MFLLFIIGLVVLCAYLAYRYIAKFVNNMGDKLKEIDVPAGYRLVGFSKNKDFYIIEDKQGKQEIVYFRN